MNRPESTAAEARRKAQALLSNKLEAERVSERDRARKAEAEKTERLRALRLAKEAEDRTAKNEVKQRFDRARRPSAGRDTD
jgi:hypothetical protein